MKTLAYSSRKEESCPLQSDESRSSSPKRRWIAYETCSALVRGEQRKVMRASVLLDSVAGLNDQAVATKNGVNRNTLVRCITKCLQFGLDAALNDLQRPGKPRQLTDDAIAWIVQLACQKPKDLGYAQELWTYRLLTQHVRRQGPGAGYPALQRLSRSKLHHLLTEAELRPHKVRYYV